MPLTPTELIESRIMAGELGQNDLIQFCHLTQPDREDRVNPFKSYYMWGEHHRLIADRLQDVEARRIKRLEIEMPPRHAKSELAIRQFVPWVVGRNPEKSWIVLTHTDELAQSHGRDVRDYMQGPGYTTVFGHKPESRLRTDSRAVDRLQTVAGGVITFSGCSGLGAGVGGDGLIVDDLFKNSEEAISKTARDNKWRAYNVDCKSRLNDQDCPIIMIGSRRNKDDAQGRIFDPTNVNYDAPEAARWLRIRLPALSEGPEVDPLKRPIGAALWPERFDESFFLEKKNSQSEIIREDFNTQCQCNPHPEEGSWFKTDWLKTYRLSDLPKHLRFYASSDHAYRKGEKNDFTCLLSCAIDPTGAIYILPDTCWKKTDSMDIVNGMFEIVQRRHPSMWWAARDAISGTLAPFLRLKMRTEKCFFPIDDSITESRDLIARSTSIRGLMAMGMVYWPSDWPQWEAAKEQLLSFPGGRDDLVAALAILGMGMDRMVKAEGPRGDSTPPRGSFEWHSFGQQQTKENNIWA